MERIGMEDFQTLRTFYWDSRVRYIITLVQENGGSYPAQSIKQALVQSIQLGAINVIIYGNLSDHVYRSSCVTTQAPQPSASPLAQVFRSTHPDPAGSLLLHPLNVIPSTPPWEMGSYCTPIIENVSRRGFGVGRLERQAYSRPGVYEGDKFHGGVLVAGTERMPSLPEYSTESSYMTTQKRQSPDSPPAQAFRGMHMYSPALLLTYRLITAPLKPVGLLSWLGGWAAFLSPV